MLQHKIGYVQHKFCCWILEQIYRVSIKYFPDYKHLLQENYCTKNAIFLKVIQEVNFRN